jgi:hypothetical protein
MISVSAAFVKRRVSPKLCHKKSFKRQLDQIHGLLVTSSSLRRRHRCRVVKEGLAAVPASTAQC